MLTWSLGCTGFLEPITPPSNWIARFEITSLAFMFDWVPEPVCQTASGKCSSSLPSITSCAAATIASPIFGSSLPSAMLASAEARLTMPSARTMALGCFSQPILKLARLRCACAPQYLFAGTWIGPKVSVSVRISVVDAGAAAVMTGRLVDQKRNMGRSRSTIDLQAPARETLGYRNFRHVDEEF